MIEWMFVIIVFVGILIYKIIDRYLEYKEFIGYKDYIETEEGGVKEYERTNDNKKVHQEKWKKI